jgi:hypothetical protein
MKSLNNLLKLSIIVIIFSSLITGCAFNAINKVFNTKSQTVQAAVDETAIPQASRTMISPSSIGEITLSTASSNIKEGDAFVTEALLNSGTQNFAAYTFTITYDSSVVAVNTDMGTSGVEAGADGFVSAVNTSTAGQIIIAGFDANGTGTGPGANLSVLKINWNAITAGNASMQLDILNIVDSSTATIGTPIATVESISIEPGTLVTPTSTPMATPTPTIGSAPCSTPTAITAPFTQDGSGEFCWSTASIGNYINCWNLDLLEINGVDFTNLYVSSSNLPPKQDGLYYIHYIGAYSWSHFEAK